MSDFKWLRDKESWKWADIAAETLGRKDLRASSCMVLLFYLNSIHNVSYFAFCILYIVFPSFSLFLLLMLLFLLYNLDLLFLYWRSAACFWTIWPTNQKKKEAMCKKCVLIFLTRFIVSILIVGSCSCFCVSFVLLLMLYVFVFYCSYFESRRHDSGPSDCQIKNRKQTMCKTCVLLACCVVPISRGGGMFPDHLTYRSKK